MAVRFVLVHVLVLVAVRVRVLVAERLATHLAEHGHEANKQRLGLGDDMRLRTLGGLLTLASIPWWWAARRAEQQAGSTTLWQPISTTGEAP